MLRRIRGSLARGKIRSCNNGFALRLKRGIQTQGAA
jgi:hypothetical protein